MDSDALRRTMIEELQYDSNFSFAECRDKLISIMNRSSVNCVSQVEFAKKRNQHWENVEIRVPIPLMKEAMERYDEILRLVFYVYEETDEYALCNVEIRPKIIYSDTEPQISNNVEFDRIQDVIIQGIRNARYLIWVAVAWFSNEVLYEELLKRKQKGVHVRVIVSDEDSNKKLLPKLKRDFECVVVPRTGAWGMNRMHDKFCIVDLVYIMHGSYNWTNVANYNGETLVTTMDNILVRAFADEFLKMYNANRKN